MNWKISQKRDYFKKVFLYQYKYLYIYILFWNVYYDLKLFGEK